MDKKTYSVDELLLYAHKYNKIPAVLFAKDKEGRYIYTSEIEDCINSGEEQSIIGKTDMDIHYDEELGKLYYEQDREIIKTGEPIHCYSQFHVNGKRQVRKISRNPFLRNGDIIGVCGVVSDVTELMELKERFEKLSVLDQGTGCYNRNYFLKYDYNSSKYLPCSYVMCDCNDLKEINDQYGHEAGDCYIRAVAKVLRAAVDKTGICIRWGGDEFLLILPQCDEAECRLLLDEIEREQEQMRKVYPKMNVAMGMSVRSGMEQSEDAVIQLADQAMYRNKAERKEGKNGN